MEEVKKSEGAVAYAIVPRSKGVKKNMINKAMLPKTDLLGEDVVSTQSRKKKEERRREKKREEEEKKSKKRGKRGETQIPHDGFQPPKHAPGTGTFSS